METVTHPPVSCRPLYDQYALPWDLLFHLMMIFYKVAGILLYFSIICVAAESRELKKNPRETNVFNFVRLVVLRLVYGFATMLGFKDSISEVADGALVPPGVEDDDYGFDDYDRDYSSMDY